MFNPLTVITLLGEIEKSLPVLQKGLTDVNQAVADQKNPAAEMTDVMQVLADLQALITALGIPAATPTPIPVAAVTPVTPAA